MTILASFYTFPQVFKKTRDTNKNGSSFRSIFNPPISTPCVEIGVTIKLKYPRGFGETPENFGGG